MINKIKHSTLKKKQSLKSRISLIIQFQKTEKSPQKGLLKKHTLISTGRTLRSPISTSQISAPSKKEPKKDTEEQDENSISRERQFKNKLLIHLKKAKAKEKAINRVLMTSHSYIPKIKHKKSKQSSRRSLPSLSFQQNLSPHQPQKQRKVSQIFIGTTIKNFSEAQQGFSRSNHVSMLIAGGRKRKVDSVMYLKKLKTKNDLNSTIFTQSYQPKIDDQTFYREQKMLFSPKQLASYRRPNLLISPRSKKKVYQQTENNHQRKHENCRPWSAAHSEYDK